MEIQIPDKENFIAGFLNPIAAISERVQFKIAGNTIKSIVRSLDQTVVLFSEFTIVNDTADEVRLININNIKKLIRGLSLIDAQQITLHILSNTIEYKSDSQQMTIHLLGDGILSTPAVSLQAINNLTFDVETSLAKDSIKKLLKGISVATDSEKIYLSAIDNKLYGELTNRAQSNIDSYKEVLVHDYAGVNFDPIALTLDNIRNLMTLDTSEVYLKILISRGVIVLEERSVNHYHTYVVTALVK